jgi:Fur family ferric uptake transcriptional regulator
LTGPFSKVEQPPSASVVAKANDNGAIREGRAGRPAEKDGNREKTVVRIDEARNPCPNKAKAGYDCPILVCPGLAEQATAALNMTHAEELKSSGLKATLPRIKILEVFQQSVDRHLTAEDVYKTLLNEGSDIALATVYRVLMQFEQAGILARSHFESGKSVFELNEGTHHDHLLCLTCGRVEEFFDPEIESRQREVAASRGFALQEHALSLYAVCKRENCEHRPPPKGVARHSPG